MELFKGAEGMFAQIVGSDDASDLRQDFVADFGFHGFTKGDVGWALLWVREGSVPNPGFVNTLDFGLARVERVVPMAAVCYSPGKEEV